MLKRIDDDEKSEYINANYVKGPKDTTNYYIATQGCVLRYYLATFRQCMQQFMLMMLFPISDLLNAPSPISGE